MIHITHTHLRVNLLTVWPKTQLRFLDFLGVLITGLGVQIASVSSAIKITSTVDADQLGMPALPYVVDVSSHVFNGSQQKLSSRKFAFRKVTRSGTCV